MSEVLSQSQIDALINAAKSGESLPSQEISNLEERYRKYDFKSPRKFTKDRLKMLNSVFESYAKSINSRVNGLMHEACEIKVESAEEQRYYEFSNALTEGDVLTLAYMKYQNKRWDMPVLLHMSKPLMLGMIDRMLGGEGIMDDDLDPEYTFTDIEMKIYERFMSYLVDGLGESWSNYLNLDFEWGRVESNPTMVQLLALEEIVVIMDLMIKFSNSDGHLSICLPGMMLTNIFSEISQINNSHRETEDTEAHTILPSLKRTDIELIAEICKTTLSFNDVLNLNVGDVIDLKRPKDSPVYINIGGKRWFDGAMGICNKNLAVKIGKTYYEPLERDVKENGR